MIDWVHPAAWPWLLLLLPLGGLLWWGWLGSRRRAARYGAAPAGRPAPPGRRAVCVVLALGLGHLAWMNPRVGEESMPVERRGLDVVVCLDVSRSMAAADLAPSRLERAVEDVVSVLPRWQGGGRAALVAFAGVPRLVVPWTHDLGAFRQLLEETSTATVRRGGSDVARALRRGLELIGEGREDTAAILLLTDGEQLSGAGRAAAREAAARDVVVHAVGYGTARGSRIPLGDGRVVTDGRGREVVTRLDMVGLRAIAGATGGEALRAGAFGLPLVELHRQRLAPRVERVHDSRSERRGKTRFQWLLLPAVVLLLVEMLMAGGRR